MRSQEEVEKAFALSARAAEKLEEEKPHEAAGPYILMRGLGWVLEQEIGDELYEDMEEEFEELVEEMNEEVQNEE